jgi:hypothetical protein
MNGHAAEAPTQQRDRHGDEREVVPDGRGVDACETDFEDEAGKRDEKDSGANKHWGLII